MSVEVSKGTRTIVHASGVIDYSNVGELNRVLDEAAQECPGGIIVDLSKTVYMDSAGVQAVLHAYRLVSSKGGALAVVLGNPNIKDILRITGAQYLPGFRICDDLPCAEEIIPECEH